jgi:hypothetical protein
MNIGLSRAVVVTSSVFGITADSCVTNRLADRRVPAVCALGARCSQHQVCLESTLCVHLFNVLLSACRVTSGPPTRVRYGQSLLHRERHPHPLHSSRRRSSSRKSSPSCLT